MDVKVAIFRPMFATLRTQDVSLDDSANVNSALRQSKALQAKIDFIVPLCQCHRHIIEFDCLGSVPLRIIVRRRQVKSNGCTVAVRQSEFCFAELTLGNRPSCCFEVLNTLLSLLSWNVAPHSGIIQIVYGPSGRTVSHPDESTYIP
jgi:hypothetical protein